MYEFNYMFTIYEVIAVVAVQWIMDSEVFLAICIHEEGTLLGISQFNASVSSKYTDQRMVYYCHLYKLITALQIS